MATPIRFRLSPERWTIDRIRSSIYGPLDSNLGASMGPPWYRQPTGYQARRFDMENGDIALFVWDDETAYWLGNTETPRALWQTEKYTFDEVPYPVARWAERELLAQLHDESPWLAAYPHLSWFFLPVFLSKDGRHTTRQFFREYAAGFPDASADEALRFYEDFLETGVLDDHRYVMAAKLGTSTSIDEVRMSAAMSEFTAAKLLVDAGYDITPESEVTTGHSIDFRVDGAGNEGYLVEVTRPLPPHRRSASTPSRAVRETAQTKTSGQLRAHGGGVTLFVDCSSFRDGAWESVLDEQPDVNHRPAVVFRARPSGRIEGYVKGAAPIDLPTVRLA